MVDKLIETSQNRVVLGEQIPLKTPFSVHIYPSYYCNFKCTYCLQCMNEVELKKMLFKRQLMEFDIYTKCIDNLAKFPDKLKALIFAGHGEPLVHKRIVDMVAYAKNLNVAERMEIVTNGYLLTTEVSDKLIAVGLDRLRISIQGLSSAAYRQMSGVDIDFDRLVEQVKYFYTHKKHTSVYIKIVDVALSGQEEMDQFFEIFGPYCDEISIEYLIPFVSDLDLSQKKAEFDRSKQGNEASTTEICSMPFYMLVLEPDGSLVPCCSVIPPVKLGSILTDDLLTVWNSKLLKQFWKMQLTEKRNQNPVCKECSVPHYGLQKGDYLDNYAQTILGKI